MTARDELVNALARRYAVAGRAEKTRILDEFVAIAGFHRKHAMRLLRCDASARRSEGKASRRIYDEAVREAIVVLWEASDRICGKRLKALMPVLVEAMERHGHLRLGAEIRAAVLAMSASTIDRSLREVRGQASGRKRRRTASPSSVRKSIPVRTFSDWDDPPPGFVEADLVVHCGPVANGSFVQTLTVTDIATGRTEWAPLLYREQTLLREVLGEVRSRLPFELLGFDTDNDSVFVNETVRDYCRDSGIVFTRCRPWRKNDQAFVEQKNGAIVRRIVGYRRLEGLEAAAAVSKTCLVRFDRNQYSVESRAVGRTVDVCAYADRIVIRQDGETVGEHPRCFERNQVLYNPWHYVPILKRKPGALRNGAPFKDWALPSALGRVRARLGRHADGDRQVVKILGAALEDGLEAACAEALAEGTCSADVVLNILARRRQPAPPAPIPTPVDLRLRLEPKADCARYEGLMEVRRGAA